jgi:hypothetical protein
VKAKVHFRRPFSLYDLVFAICLNVSSALLLALFACAYVPAAAQPIPASVDAPLVLGFKDFFVVPIGPRGLEMKDALRQAQGHDVVLTGYMVQQEAALPGQFMLAPRPVQMSQHADGEADDLPPATVLVRLDASQIDWIVPHSRGLIQVRGVLHVGRQENRDGRVFWVQLQLSPQATRGMTPVEFAFHLHSLQHSH